MKHNYTDTQLQAAIDEAFPQGRTEDIHRLTLSPVSLYWKEEAPNRLVIIKSVLAALPEPVDEESMLLNLLAVIHRDGGHYQSEHGTRKAVDDAHKEWARLISVVEETEPKQSLSQLRPLAEAGEVPEGCVRYHFSKYGEDLGVGTKAKHLTDVLFADIRLPAPAEADPYAELKAAHADGKIIEQIGHGSSDWFGCGSSIAWSRPPECYRIKPEPETFEAHGKTWTRHTPGDAMPCDGSSAVMALLGDGTFCTQQAEDWNWNNRNSTFDIVGWCYADEPLVTKPISPPTPIKDGGPAFPVADSHHANGQVQYGANGMSLRDWFAGEALAGYLASWSDDSDPNFFEPYHTAKTSYAYADAMLKAREVKP